MRNDEIISYLNHTEQMNKTLNNKYKYGEQCKRSFGSIKQNIQSSHFIMYVERWVSYRIISRKIMFWTTKKFFLSQNGRMLVMRRQPGQYFLTKKCLKNEFKFFFSLRTFR